MVSVVCFYTRCGAFRSAIRSINITQGICAAMNESLKLECVSFKKKKKTEVLFKQ